MQHEIDAAHPRRAVQILGVNKVGEEAENDLICQGRTLPWLQETASHPVWMPWNATWRDVVILDPQNRRAGLYNLTPHDLAVQANYDTLKAMILRVANQ